MLNKNLYMFKKKHCCLHLVLIQIENFPHFSKTPLKVMQITLVIVEKIKQLVSAYFV